MTRQIHQLLPTLAYGDAIGNHVLELRKLFREQGYESEIFAERWHPKLEGMARPFREYDRVSRPDNVVLLHYSTGGEVNDYAMHLPDRVLLYYHNITPPHFFYRVNGEFARRLMEARQSLSNLAGQAPAIAASEYNAKELDGFGFQVVGVAPYVVRFEGLDAGLHSPGAERIRQRFAREGSFDWLYVGRYAPNKCLPDLIRAFYYYHTWINQDSRLLLVGTGDGVELHVNELYRLVSALGLDGAVVFAGHHSAEEGLAAFYDMADVYVSMSEHEGFCIPLVEAMHYDLPVVAYAATGVPYTMGDAGVLIRRKEPALIAETVHEMGVNDGLRHQVVAGQRRRLRAFAPEDARSQIMAVLEPYLKD